MSEPNDYYPSINSEAELDVSAAVFLALVAFLALGAMWLFGWS